MYKRQISISGHKVIGSPIPCGIVLALKSNVGRIARAVEYVGTLDSTVSGSRHGFTPLLLWYAIKSKGFNGFKKMARESIRSAEYAVNKFNENSIEAWKNDNAITVVFPKPSKSVCEKWQLAIQDDLAHVLCMPQATNELIDELVYDVLNK